MSKLLSVEEKDKLIDDATKGWEDVLKFIADGGDITFAFLKLARSDLLVSASTVDCPYCSKHIIEEAKLIERTMDLAKLANAYLHSHGLKEKLSLAGSAVKITFYIALGGLRRAGLIH